MKEAKLVPDRILRLAAVLLLAAPLALPTTAVAKRAQTSFDESVDFSQFKTYRWEKPEGPGTESLDRPVRAAADKTLAERGLKPAADGEAADLELRYNAGRVDQLVAGVAVTAGWWGDLVAIPAGESYTTGGIAFILRDPKTDKVVWTGWKVESGTNDNAAVVMLKRAPKYTRTILELYPPR